MVLRITLTWLALIALLAATMAASMMLSGTSGLVMGLTIAACKASLVAAVFMHLSRQSGLMRIAALGALIWLFILLFLVGMDYVSRRGF